jgi:heme/copper-type cytochrome/quinol oxidase subunit 2
MLGLIQKGYNKLLTVIFLVVTPIYSWAIDYTSNPLPQNLGLDLKNNNVEEETAKFGLKGLFIICVLVGVILWIVAGLLFIAIMRDEVEDSQNGKGHKKLGKIATAIGCAVIGTAFLGVALYTITQVLNS